MLGAQERWQEDLFVAGPLSALIPEAAVRLMLAGFFQGVVQDRKLMREAQVNLAIRWFAGYRLHEALPDHSSLTRIRRRWGAERFKRIFQRVVQACLKAKLIRADVSWESVSERHAERVWEENREEEPKRVKKAKKFSRTDPEATLSTSRGDFPLQPCYKQHTVVDDKAGVIVDVEVTTGEANEGQRLLDQLGRVEAVTGKKVETVTADGAYGHSANYAALEERGTEAVIPPQRPPSKVGRIPLRRFKYDAGHQVVRCPAGKLLSRRTRNVKQGGWWYRSEVEDCCGCSLRASCFSATARRRSVLIADGYEALLRARRWKARWDERTRRQYERHRWLVEGRHGEAKTQHGLARAVRRGLANVAIQVYLTATVMNLKRLAAAFLTVWCTWRLRRSLRAGFSRSAHLSRITDFASAF